MIVLGAACLMAGLSLSIAGGVGPKIGLGSADQFLLYRTLGIARHRALVSGGMFAALMYSDGLAPLGLLGGLLVVAMLWERPAEVEHSTTY